MTSASEKQFIGPKEPDDELRYVNVVGPEENYDYEEMSKRIFHDRDEAAQYCYYYNRNIETAKGFMFGQKAVKHVVHTVPITVHWKDLH